MDTGDEPTSEARPFEQHHCAENCNLYVAVLLWTLLDGSREIPGNILQQLLLS